MKASELSHLQQPDKYGHLNIFCMQKCFVVALQLILKVMNWNAIPFEPQT